MLLITGDELYRYVAGDGATPSADDAAWAELVAQATNAAVERELEASYGVPYVDPRIVSGEWAGSSDLHVGALASAAERFKRREAPFGIAGYDVSGGAVRLSADDLKAARAAIERWHPTGGIAVA